MIALTAASGNVGRALSALLDSAEVPARLLVRAVTGTDRPRHEQVAVDLDSDASLDAALAGITRLFLLSPGPDTPAQDAAAVSAAVRAGVEHVVLLSSLGVEAGGTGGGREHAPGEQALLASGLGHTILRPSEFMTNTLAWLGEAESRGSISVPSGSGRVAFVDPADIAAVAFAALTGEGHDGRTYRLTGPESLSTADVAARMSEVLGAPVVHRDTTLEQFRVGAAQGGLPARVVDTLAAYYPALAAGVMDIVSADVEHVTGRPATSYLAWFRSAVGRR